jgi:PAT family beta-lactamase induction signal transducer AmpG
MGLAFVVGFISGFILLISGNTLNFWLAETGLDITSIGLFSLISLPYAINFFWAPLLDKIRLPFFAKLFGHRSAWIYCLQILLAISVYMLSLPSIQLSLVSFAFCAFIVAFLSATGDTAIGALRTELLSVEEQKKTAGIYILGYRIGMLLSSSGAIFLSAILSWQEIYQLFSYVILTFPFLLHFVCKNYQIKKSDNSLKFISFSKLSKQFGSPRFVVYLLLFLVLYRMPDNFINVMINPFLLQLGYKAGEIASVGKFLGIMVAILGGFIASFIMHKRSIYNSLMIFGIIHAIAHSMFIAQDIVGYNLTLLFIVMGFESVTGGMTMAAYMAFIGSLCHGPYRATQYAFLTSMMGLSRSILPGLSGFIVEEYGWSLFYLFTSVAAIPSILLVRYLKDK